MQNNGNISAILNFLSLFYIFFKFVQNFVKNIVSLYHITQFKDLPEEGFYSIKMMVGECSDYSSGREFFLFCSFVLC